MPKRAQYEYECVQQTFHKQKPQKFFLFQFLSKFHYRTFWPLASITLQEKETLNLHCTVLCTTVLLTAKSLFTVNPKLLLLPRKGQTFFLLAEILFLTYTLKNIAGFTLEFTGIAATVFGSALVFFLVPNVA